MNHRELISKCWKKLPIKHSMPLTEYMKWLINHEGMYLECRRFAIEALNQKRKRFSPYMIRERVRWYVVIEHGGPGPFKISNNLTPYLGRTLAIDLPKLQTIFSFKGPMFRPEPEQGNLDFLED